MRVIVKSRKVKNENFFSGAAGAKTEKECKIKDFPAGYDLKYFNGCIIL